MIVAAFNSFLVMLLCIPAVTLLAGSRKNLRLVTSILLLVAVSVGAMVAGGCWWRGGGLTLDLSGFGPLPLALAIDRLSAFFLLLICVVAAPVVLFSMSYVERHYEGARRTWLWVLLPWFLLSMVMVVTASTAFAFLFGWELMTLFSAGLILIDGDSKSGGTTSSSIW